MSPAHEAHEALEIARQVRAIVAEIDDRLTSAATYAEQTRKLAAQAQALAERTRRLTVLLAAVVAVVLAVAVVAGFSLAGLAEKGRDIHASQIRACQIGNDGRAAQRRLWNHVISLSHPDPVTARNFERYIARQFRAVNCQALYRKSR